jgi:hypothetical protein
MEARRAAELDKEWKAVRRGWCLGGKEFRRDLLKEMRCWTGSNHGRQERRETEEAKAERLIAQELKRRWTGADLARRRKDDGQKVMIALRMHQETTMTLRWIAKRLSMRVAGSLANLLRDAEGKREYSQRRVVRRVQRGR